MEIIEHELFPVCHRNAADGVAAVKVDELHKALLDGERAADGGRDGKGGIGDDARPVRPVRGEVGVEEIGTVVVLRVDLVKLAALHHIAEVGVLGDVPAARAVDVDLLKESEIRRESLDERGLATHVFINSFGAAGAALLTAVHEEAVIAAVGAEAHVGRRDAVSDVRPGRVLHGDGGFAGGAHHVERLIVFHAVVGGEDIDHIGERGQNEGQKRKERDFQRLFHRKNSFRGGEDITSILPQSA